MPAAGHRHTGWPRNDGTPSCRAHSVAPCQILAAIPDRILKESCGIAGIPETIWLRNIAGLALARGWLAAKAARLASPVKPARASPVSQPGQAPRIQARIARSDSFSDPMVASTADGS